MAIVITIYFNILKIIIKNKNFLKKEEKTHGGFIL